MAATVVEALPNGAHRSLAGAWLGSPTTRSHRC